ncbi:hypothetical protein Efla_002542 [Eimeria flavescens]
MMVGACEAAVAASGAEKHGREGEAQRGKRVESCGQKARSLQRLLEHRKDLPEEVQARMRATAEALQKQHRQRLRELKRQRFIKGKKVLYSKLKFYELKKVQRRLQQTRKKLVGLLAQQQEAAAAAATDRKKKQQQATGERGEALAKSIAVLQQQLRLQLDDLNYIRLYPGDEPYVALFPTHDSEDSQQKRNAMRLRIRELMLKSRRAEVAEEDDDAGNDDMFVDAAPEEQAGADAADPFEEARALSDEEAEAGLARSSKAFPTRRQQQSHKTDTGRRRPPAGARTTSEASNKRQQGRHPQLPSTRSAAFLSRHLGHKQKKDRLIREGKQLKPSRDQRGRQIQQTADSREALPNAKGEKLQPLRVGLSKHKVAGQHVIFDSDEE